MTSEPTDLSASSRLESLADTAHMLTTSDLPRIYSSSNDIIMPLNLPVQLEPLESRLREFFQGMLYKLDLNAHKKTPEIEDIPNMVMLLIIELAEFATQFRKDRDDVNTLIELFDTANFAFLMFLTMRNAGAADWQNVPGETPNHEPT